MMNICSVEHLDQIPTLHDVEIGIGRIKAPSRTPSLRGLSSNGRSRNSRCCSTEVSTHNPGVGNDSLSVRCRNSDHNQIHKVKCIELSRGVDSGPEEHIRIKGLRRQSKESRFEIQDSARLEEIRSTFEWFPLI